MARFGDYVIQNNLINDAEYKLVEKRMNGRLRFYLYKKIINRNSRFSFRKGFYTEILISWKEIDWHFEGLKDEMLAQYFPVQGKTIYLDNNGKAVNIED